MGRVGGSRHMEPGQISGLHGEVSGLPVPLSAGVTEQRLPELRVYSVATEWSQCDLVRGSRQRYLQQWTLLADNNDHKSIKTVLPPGPCVPVSGELLSRLSPVHGLRAVVREKGDRQLLEIWDGHGLSKCLNLTALNKHGSVYDDTQFGCLSWSRCEDKLLYVAERSRNVSGERPHPQPDCQKSGSVSVLEGVPSDVSPGQALWAPCGQSVFFVGWYHEPFRLGLKFCSNRRSALFKLDLDGNCERLSGDNLSVSCPRLSPDGSTLIYLQGRVFGPHNQCLCLQQLDLDSGKTSTLLDVVNRPPADSQRVVFSSACRNQKDVFMVDRRTNRVTSLSDSLNERYGSWKLLAVQEDLMVVCCSSPTGLDFGAILVKPSSSLSKARFPLVVFIHGGPHSQFPAEWNSTTAGLVQLGFAVLMVNYRGSTGFGQDSILSLMGQIGSQDVKDVQRAVLAALQTDVTLDSKRVAAIGGSHGGFLSCHLIGQYPEFYRACAVRNPVINAATSAGHQRYTSVGLQYSYQEIPTAEALAAMLEKSPITHAAQIKAPVLLMLGGRDRRVNPHQGLELYRALKSRASPVRLLWFPEDGHSLSRVDTQADCFLNTALWLQQHL
ncbi:hypothetical protein fugu_006721 [Takifugu bimaculatus]|uniref:Acylamino-acid-releasing enzyme n=1 Tax=Takifugu bimaculatus TaxID=433685 RepID=A0A4Z2B2C9_9TELE|nr:hypothetical protein fugu_006721 [Takifugu bimaculatus]